MIGSVVEFAELQRLSGYERRADVARWAAEIGLPTKPCREGLWTTVEAMNHALGVAARVDAMPYPGDIV